MLAARASTLIEVAGECEQRGGRALAVPTDVSDEAALQALADRAVEMFGRIDAWVNAAAVWSDGRFEDTPSQVFRQVVDTTLFGQVHAARAVLPVFRSQGHGVLVNISSLYGRLSSPTSPRTSPPSGGCSVSPRFSARSCETRRASRSAPSCPAR